MHDSSVLVSGRVVITIQADRRTKPPGAEVSVTLGSHIFRRVPVVLASGERLGTSETWLADCAASYPHEVGNFPRRDLVNGMTLHGSLVGGDHWAGSAVGVQLQLTFAEPGGAERDW